MTMCMYVNNDSEFLIIMCVCKKKIGQGRGNTIIIGIVSLKALSVNILCSLTVN